MIRSVRLQSPGSLVWRPSPPFAQAVLEAQGLGIALSTGDVLQLGAPKALQEGVWPLLLHLHPVGHPRSQHEQDVRHPGESVRGKGEGEEEGEEERGREEDTIITV